MKVTCLLALLNSSKCQGAMVYCLLLVTGQMCALLEIKLTQVQETNSHLFQKLLRQHF